MTTPAASPGAGESWKRSQEFPVRPAVTRQSSRPPAWGALKDGAAPRAGENYYKAVPVPMVRDPVLSIAHQPVPELLPAQRPLRVFHHFVADALGVLSHHRQDRVHRCQCTSAHDLGNGLAKLISRCSTGF